jgi:hypothetical protein
MRGKRKGREVDEGMDGGQVESLDRGNTERMVGGMVVGGKMDG